ncbi:uncharacterized protein N7483_006463 [Penicillium malachiteum]|uniref:uncharacterized protein n=1 Tax=Penicillium malachiteum TaxID=1324776 RepID=UPI002549027C|nr:uncharacterized protein N7483_006463 [Penicillium malachiteum]KAJ5725106.1 hypothetical protein N7483_006463 [Penicillium malachiteum]
MAFARWKTPLSYLGLATLAYTSLQLTSEATTFLLPSTLQTYNPTNNNWALVTGATDGIGFGFCQELCSRGFNVILHGRNAKKLERRARELEAEFPRCKTGIVVLDVVGVNSSIDEIATQVHEILKQNGGYLSVLVNNVGGDAKPYTLLDGNTFAEAQETMDKNAVFMLHITRVLIPLLEEGERGLVMNISSVSAYGMPYISVYSASKGFVETFTRALEAECVAAGRHVDIMGLRVGTVKTAGFDIATNLFVPTGRVLASAGLNRVGCGQVIPYAYFWHWLQGLSFYAVPRRMLMNITVKKMMSLKAEQESKEKQG